MKKMRGGLFYPNGANYDEMDSPVGKLTIIASAAGLHAILWDNDRNNSSCEKTIVALNKCAHDKIIIATKQQLNEYFQKKRKNFDLPLAPNGTDFQIQAWKQLLKIPYAETISYAEQAEKIGGRNKARAVGMANGLNPISIIIPCHRVIGSNGHLTGFAGGIEKKRYLLALERTNGVKS